MQKELYTWDQLQQLDDLTVIQYMAPVIAVLVAAEWLIGYYKQRSYYDNKDALAAIAIGAVNAILGAGLKITLFAFAMVVYNQVPWAIPRVWWGIIVCFLAVDFCRYWAHRISHEQRFWWATHVTHHSSHKMNFSVSFRTGWTNHLKFIFFVPVPLIGIDPFTFFLCHQAAVLYQFFVHTELVRKLPAPIEYLFVTPSHHRVHHGSNARYLDCNYGSTFIIWDRMFGTFIEESEKPVYGLTTPVKSYNPVYLVFHEWMSLAQDLRHCTSITEALKLLFSPPGTLITAHQKRKVVSKATEKVEETDRILIEG